MASPIKSGKQSVNLAAKSVPGSRIRREPPPIAKQTVVPDRDELDRRAAAVGIVAFALAIVVIIIAFANWSGWSPRQYTIVIRDEA